MCNSKDLVPIDIGWSSEVMCTENDTYHFNIHIFSYIHNTWDDDESEDNEKIGDDDYTVILP